MRGYGGNYRLLAILVMLGAVKACYYQALNLENPSDFYYRYCYAGVSLTLIFNHEGAASSGHSLGFEANIRLIA
jgi:hypothetical protein